MLQIRSIYTLSSEFDQAPGTYATVNIITKTDSNIIRFGRLPTT